MADTYHDVRQAIAAGTPLDLLCQTCRWDRVCVQTPVFTPGEVGKQLEAVRAKVSTRPDRVQANAALQALAMYGGRDTDGTMCPVLIARLRAPEGRQVADGFRAVMRGITDAPTQ